MAFFLLALALASLPPASAIDLKFRWDQGYCQRGGAPGFNPNHWGECGNQAQSSKLAEHLTDLNWRGMNLNSSSLINLQVSKSDVRNISLRRALLLQNSWDQVNFSGADLRGALIKKQVFRKSEFTQALALGARLQKVSWEDCDLSGLQLWGAQLIEVSFRGSDLSGANLHNTYLLFVDFKDAKFDSKTRLPFSHEEALKRGMIHVDAVL